MIKTIKDVVSACLSIPGNFSLQAEFQDRQLMLAGRMSSAAHRNLKKIETLADTEFRVFSQWGEDGIIEWLIQNVPIKNTTFVEFGVENYFEANTRFLLQNRNWRGLIMDGNPAYMNYVRSTPMHWKYDLTAVSAFITAENINELLESNGFTGEIGLLSIDIDGNDYWVLDAIDVVKPCILVCEYNPIFGDMNSVSVPYRPDFTRFEAHYSGLYFGASLAAIRYGAERKGYRFVGSCLNGINAFFVRSDLFPHVAPLIETIRGYPSRHRDSRDKNGQLSYTSGLERFELIKTMPVTCVEKDRQAPLFELDPVYSDAWLADH